MKLNVTKDYIHALKRRIDLVRVFGLMDKRDDFATRKFIEGIEKLKKLIEPLLIIQAGN